MLARLICWWFGHEPDIEAVQDAYTYDDVPCARCGQSLGYEDMAGLSRHERVKDWLSYWAWHRWAPARCPACGERFKCKDDCDGIPF